MDGLIASKMSKTDINDQQARNSTTATAKNSIYHTQRVRVHSIMVLVRMRDPSSSERDTKEAEQSEQNQINLV